MIKVLLIVHGTFQKWKIEIGYFQKIPVAVALRFYNELTDVLFTM